MKRKNASLPSPSSMDLYTWSGIELEAAIFLVHSCAWLPDNKGICDAIKRIKETAEKEIERRKREIEHD